MASRKWEEWLNPRTWEEELTRLGMPTPKMSRPWVGGYGAPVSPQGGAATGARFVQFAPDVQKVVAAASTTQKASALSGIGKWVVGGTAAGIAYQAVTGLMQPTISYHTAAAGQEGIYQTISQPREELGGLSLTEYNALLFGSGYGTGLPTAYLEAQRTTQPELAKLTAENYAKLAPIYMEVERLKMWDEAKTRREISDYYAEVEKTEKANVKMPYNVIIK